MTLPLITPEFHDDFSGTAADLSGRVSTSGHTWGDPNDRFAINGSGLLIAQDYSETSRYADVTLNGDDCYGMSATGIWSGTSSVITDNSGLVLVSGASADRPGAPGSMGIFNNCIHPVFGDWQTVVDIWVDGAAAATPLLTYTYPGGVLTRDTPYTMGWELTGSILTIYMPDGAVKKIADHRLPAWIGKYLIAQIYNTGHTANQPAFTDISATSEPIPGYVPPPPLPATLGVDLMDY